MKRKMKMRTLWTMAVLMVFAFVLQSCQQGGQQGEQQEAVDIELGYVLWDSEIASTHVVASLIQDSLGHNVTLTSVDAGPMWMGIGRGDFDAIVAAWLPVTHEAYYNEVKDDVVNLGPNLDGARLGWVVPSYVEASSIEDLPQYSDELGGQITGIDPGAGLMAASEKTIEEYGLGDDFELLAGSDAAMTAALERAIEREEYVVVTGWTPHWMFAAHDLKYLEDPKKTLGDVEHIATIVTPELEEKAPEVYTFLDNFYWSPVEMAEVMMMIEGGMEPYDAARAWIEENPDRVSEWL